MNASANNDNESATALREGVKCAICAAPAAETYAPFCSKRCADIDLHRWLNGSYAIPAIDDESDGALTEPDEA